MVSEIGKFKNLGEIIKIFFNSLGVNKEILKRIKKESDIDLEEIDIKIDEYFNELEGKTQIINYDKNNKIYKLNKDTIKYLKKIFIEFKEGYIEFVKEVIVGVEQERLDEEMSKNFFHPLLSKIMLDIYHCNRNSFYLKDIRDTNYYEQIKKIILEKLGKENFAFLIKDEGYYNLNTDYMKLKNLGKNFHSNESLNELVELISKLSNRIEKEKLEFSLFFARFYTNFINEVSGKNNEINIGKKNIFIQIIREKEILQLLNNININLNDSEICLLIDLDKCLINNQKENFLIKYKIMSQNNIKMKYYLSYLYAKYLVKENRLEEALKYFKLALEQGEYRAGKFLNQIIKNGLEISSKLGKRREFKNFLKKSYFYEIISSSYKKEGDWLFEHYKKNLKLSANISTMNTFNEIELNIKKPNLKIEYRGRVRSQLEIFSTFPSYGNKVKEELYQDNIKRLLKKGADINFINSTGETPLIGALCARNYERALILLEDKNISKSINQHSLRRNNTALSVLLDNIGLLNNISFNEAQVIKKVLRKLIENSININDKVVVGNISPIYLVLALYFKENNLSDFPSVLENKSDIEKIRKYISFLDNPILTNEKIRDFYNIIFPMLDPFLKYYNDKNKKMKNFLLEILEILLENGADINLVHEELQGYTPFLFSIEIGDLDVFELFCKYNPNINQKNMSFMGPLEIALLYNHFELFKELINKYSFKEYNTLEKKLMLLHYTYEINRDSNLSYDKIKIIYQIFLSINQSSQMKK